MVGTRRKRKQPITKQAHKTTIEQFERSYKRRKLATSITSMGSGTTTISIEKQVHKHIHKRKKIVCSDEFQSGSSGTSDKEHTVVNCEETIINETDNANNSSLLTSEAGETENDVTLNNSPFCFHFEREIKSEEMQHKKELDVTWSHIGNFKYINYPKITKIDLSNSVDVMKYRVKPNEAISPLQKELLNIFYNYIDFFYHLQRVESRELHVAYCLHVLNHILTSRAKIVHHNNKIKKHETIPEEFRDQGFTRPKVLIVVPFKHVALQIVTIMAALLGEEINVMNKKKFYKEYGTERTDTPKCQKPEDYEATFKGNIDDSFRIGITVRRKCLKLYTEFYSSDIIIASPLGLRTIIGASGEEDCDCDFLSSIEILIFDKCDIFLMQNWEHVINIMHHLHLKPQKSHDCNYFRVRMWVLDGLSKLYRQTLIFSSVVTPPILSLFNKYCFNHAGKIILNTVAHGFITKVLVQLPQVFHRFDANSIQSISEERLSFFVEKILPQFRNTALTNVLIFVPYYWDFVRLRNYFRQQDINFTQMCEYSKSGKIAEARDHFFHGRRKFVLFTERFHFFHRYQIKGISHIIFYQLPVYPHFYAELCNYMNYTMQNKKASVLKSTCTVLYCKYDFLQLSSIVGTEKSNYLLSGEKNVHMFVSGT